MSDEPRKLEIKPEVMRGAIRVKIRFDGVEYAEMKAWCDRNLIPFSKFVRRATEEFWKRVKD